jgi:hypothetical protein
VKHVHTPPAPPIEELVDERLARVVEHPDGWYWLAPDGHQQFGPFESMEAVLADMDIADAGPDAGQTLAETERVMGLSDWIDPDTGTLAEDTPVRLEDH